MIPEIATDVIYLLATAGKPITIKHGLGRQVAGYLVVWRDAPCDFTIQDPAADCRQELVLVPDGTANVRLVLL
jgi:hypothetical protein